MYRPGFQFLTSDKQSVDYQTEATSNIMIVGRMINEAIRALTDANIEGVGGVVGTYDYNILGDAMMKIYHGALSADTSYGISLQRERFEGMLNRISNNVVTLFNDSLAEYSGSAVPEPWTLQSGSFTFGASGATTGANGSLMTAGNTLWKPTLGPDGLTKLPISAQATFKTTATPSTTEFGVYLFVDANNQYLVNVNGTGSNAFPILKKVGGTYTTLNSVAFSPVASTTYEVSLQLDNTGLLTATITPSGGSTTTLQIVDKSLLGGFLIGVGGDTGVIISSASVSGAFPRIGFAA